ncbi:MAG: hypothetical protein AVDCRST_MAG53-3535, partial [uncultured Solirubrobacteraceae bacterium]
GTATNATMGSRLGGLLDRAGRRRLRGRGGGGTGSRGLHAGGDQHHAAREVRSRHDDGQAAEEGRDHDRRQVRRAAVRLQEPFHRRHRRVRHRLRQGGGRCSRRQAQVHRGDLGQPHTVHHRRHRRPDPLDDDDQRGAGEGDQLHRSVLHRQGAHPAEEGRGHRRRGGPRGQAGLHGAGLDLRGDAEEGGPQGQAASRRLVLRVPRTRAERWRGRGQHRRRDPHGHDHPRRLAGARRRRGAHDRALRRGPEEGRHGVHGVPQRGAREVRVRRPLEGRLPEVARPVHRREGRAADPDARGRRPRRL